MTDILFIAILTILYLGSAGLMNVIFTDVFEIGQGEALHLLFALIWPLTLSYLIGQLLMGVIVTLIRGLIGFIKIQIRKRKNDLTQAEIEANIREEAIRRDHKDE